MSDLAAVSPFSPWRFIRSGTLLTFGVALPLGALLFELITHFSARALFDPIPTFAHVFLVAFVVAANAWCCYVVTRQRFTHALWAMRAIGFTIGIATYYSVLYAPVLPIASFGVLYYHLCALAFAPLSALIVALRLRVHLSRRAKEEAIKVRAWPSILAALATLVLLNAPETITRVTLRMADGDTMETRARGLHLLRMFGSDRVLLRMCYERGGSFLDLLGIWFNYEDPIRPESARDFYYRKTGRLFNSVPAPVNLARGRQVLFDTPGLDADQGSGQVGQRLHDVSLTGSRLDGSVSADAALGYLEWTLVFSNKGTVQREARAQIALPPGAVVSRLTLWIDGDEREAAFAGRRDVQQAYQRVVARNRDPALVTSAGPDRISLQIFPVPPSGEMKVRVGMTIPLRVTVAHDGILYLPYFHERNFQIDDGFRHAVWIESTSRLRGTHVSLRAGDKPNVFRADVEDAHLVDASVLTMRGGQSVAWAGDPHAEGQIVRQQISDERAGPPSQVVIVVDGSRPMEDAVAPIAKRLAEIPAGIDVRLVFADDQSDHAIERRVLTGAAAAKEIARFDYDGGQGNADALSRGIDIADEQPDSVLLWIHGPQPVWKGMPMNFEQRLTRGPKLKGWYELQLVPGTNLMTEDMQEASSFPATLRVDELPELISSWREGARRAVVTRERLAATDVSALPASQKTSDHLVRLWANDEIGRMTRDSPQLRSAAIEMARGYQLVTAISGAVVLETQQQYDASGLQPVPEGTVPTIPEPEEWALIVAALLTLAYAYHRHRARAAA